ncbi:crotonase/enoyl-CoA hydratase family protein [Rhodococcus sp. IEGM 248]|uniref:crotonase/enoyl-CoA hydratase family protein n=1 Tax=Rhodococcus opacus TaxID=37919 RepID=UPI0013C0CE58|nr:crotonase/enoyl-CoA hydratase family protein [Rhodococcus opacus]MDV7088323.1 crotonase/enoyl-CoA hydratase family protein [Rhodococcus opacus]NDV10280.1 crotonase/enoyl-CoA hydratase family protein [Rhodococcus sp. IEGM 248]
MSDIVTLDVADGVAVITLNRPEVRNAANAELAADVAAAVDEIDARADVRVTVLTGSGGTFCSGMDLKAFLNGERASLPVRGFAGFTGQPPKTPTIAAVEGAAVAGGCELVLACDMVVAADNAKFGVPEVKRGLVAVGGALLRLPQRIPYQLAMELILTGDLMDATTAHTAGLVNHLTAPGDALDAALRLAHKIAANGPLALKASKEIMQRAPQWAPDEAYELQRAIAKTAFESADAKEGARAFAEKRQPVWQGV